jgi:hypothetical protein
MEADPSPDQSSREKAYRMEYLKWVSSLDPRDRATLKDMGLDRPKIEATAAVWGRAEVFRDSPASETFSEWSSPIDHTHPGELIDAPEDDAEGIDTDDLEKLNRCDPENLALLLRVLIVPSATSGIQPKAIVARVIALAHCLHLQGIGDLSLDALAQRIGCTRALLSFYVTQLRDYGGLDHRAGKSVEARAAYSAAQLWRRNREARERREVKKAGAVPGIDTEKITEGAV